MNGKALGHAGEQGVVPKLLPLLKDAHDDVRWLAAWVLACLADPRAADALAECAPGRARHYPAGLADRSAESHRPPPPGGRDHDGVGGSTADGPAVAAP